MYREGNWRVWIPSAIAAYFIAGFAYYAGKFIANSNSAGGAVALLAMVGSFLLLATRSNGSVAEVKNPPGLLTPLSSLLALAEVKDALAAKYFSDKRWSLESLNEQKGQAAFTMRLQDPPLGGNGMPKERLVILTVRVKQLSQATAVALSYEVGGEKLTQHTALKVCEQTTQHIEQQLNFAGSAARS